VHAVVFEYISFRCYFCQSIASHWSW